MYILHLTYNPHTHIASHPLLNGKALDLPHPALLLAARRLSADTSRKESGTHAERERWRAEAT